MIEIVDITLNDDQNRLTEINDSVIAFNLRT